MEGDPVWWVLFTICSRNQGYLMRLSSEERGDRVKGLRRMEKV